MRRALALASLFVFASTAPAAAQLPEDVLGIGGRDLIPWPQALPPAEVPNEVRPHPVAHCRKASVKCVLGLERRLRKQWRRFDASCDHRAVIAYSYLQITRGLRKDMAGPRPGIVRYRRWMAYLITTFSNRYFAAFRDHAAGRPVAEAWRITFETAAERDASAGQEVLLFSNAHVQHDLPFAYEEMGVRARSGASRKPDHDAVNAINAAVFDPIEDYIAAHYDPTFGFFDLPLAPLEEVGALELVKLWRESAWRSAERLLAAESPAERARVVAQIQRSSTAWAELISAFEFPGLRATRDEWCATH
jgi:hypothetical protein